MGNIFGCEGNSVEQRTNALHNMHDQQSAQLNRGEFRKFVRQLHETPAKSGEWWDKFDLELDLKTVNHTSMEKLRQKCSHVVAIRKFTMQGIHTNDSGLQDLCSATVSERSVGRVVEIKQSSGYVQKLKTGIVWTLSDGTTFRSDFTLSDFEVMESIPETPARSAEGKILVNSVRPYSFKSDSKPKEEVNDLHGGPVERSADWWNMKEGGYVIATETFDRVAFSITPLWRGKLTIPRGSTGRVLCLEGFRTFTVEWDVWQRGKVVSYQMEYPRVDEETFDDKHYRCNHTEMYDNIKVYPRDLWLKAREAYRRKRKVKVRATTNLIYGDDLYDNVEIPKGLEGDLTFSLDEDAVLVRWNNGHNKLHRIQYLNPLEVPRDDDAYEIVNGLEPVLKTVEYLS